MSCVIAAWIECIPEKPSWCQNERVCQGAKCTGYCAIYMKTHLSYLSYFDVAQERGGEEGGGEEEDTIVSRGTHCKEEGRRRSREQGTINDNVSICRVPCIRVITPAEKGL